MLCVHFLKPFRHWWKLLACRCNPKRERLFGLGHSLLHREPVCLAWGCITSNGQCFSQAILMKDLEGLGFRNRMLWHVISGYGWEGGIHQWFKLLPSDVCLVSRVSQASEIPFAWADVRVTQKMLSPLTFKDAAGLSVFSWVVDLKIIWRIHLQSPALSWAFVIKPGKESWFTVYVAYPESNSHTQELILREEGRHDLSSKVFQSSSQPLYVFNVCHLL